MVSQVMTARARLIANGCSSATVALNDDHACERRGPRHGTRHGAEVARPCRSRRMHRSSVLRIRVRLSTVTPAGAFTRERPDLPNHV